MSNFDHKKRIFGSERFAEHCLKETASFLRGKVSNTYFSANTASSSTASLFLQQAKLKPGAQQARLALAVSGVFFCILSFTDYLFFCLRLLFCFVYFIQFSQIAKKLTSS